MRRNLYFPVYLALLAFAVLGLLNLSLAFGQTGGTGDGGDTGGGGNVGNGGDTGNQNGLAGVAGVEIDPQGVLRVKQHDARLTRVQLQAARQTLPPQLASSSPLRKVSLNRLEREVARRVTAGQQPSLDMVAMAGLTRLQYVFFLPPSGEIVLAGPAEGFGQDSVGRLIGVDSLSPCLLLDDVIVALRAFGPQGNHTRTISVSIDPTEQGLARMQQALRQLGGQFRTAADIPGIVNALKQALGPNTVTITGVPAGTHFAHVLTEADYRMKLIGIGLETPPVPMRSYVDRLTAPMGSGNALVRWYFVPNYQAVRISHDALAMELVGGGVRLVDEAEMVQASGERTVAGQANPASRAFTAEFTDKFPQISRAHPVYAQLRNLVDLTIAAAFIQDSGLYEQADWDLGIFASEDGLAVELLPPPKQVETAIHAVRRGQTWITPIGGGVAIDARRALRSENLRSDDGSADQARQALDVGSLAEGQWWWD